MEKLNSIFQENRRGLFSRLLFHVNLGFYNNFTAGLTSC